MMITPTLAHVGHWLETVGLALPPLLLLVGVTTAALIARRQEAERTATQNDPKGIS